MSEWSVRISLGILGLACGCSDPEIDLQDELGLESDAYELVFVDTTQVETASSGIPPSSPPSIVPGNSRATLPMGGAIAFHQDGQYTVQLGVYGARRAREQVDLLSQTGYPAYAIPGPSGSAAVRVRIGYFSTKEDAERFGALFAEEHGGSFWVDRRINE